MLKIKKDGRLLSAATLIALLLTGNFAEGQLRTKKKVYGDFNPVRVENLKAKSLKSPKKRQNDELLNPYTKSGLQLLNKKQTQKFYTYNTKSGKTIKPLQNKSITAPGDTLFFQDFEVAQWPANILRVNRDGRTPAADVAAVDNAWVLGTLAAYNGNTVARSTSWYAPVGTADDWMITPPLTIDNNDYELIWKARAVDPQFPDGYSVRVCTNCPANFTNANVLGAFGTVLYNTTAELAVTTGGVPIFQERKLSLSNYKNQTIRLAFRNNSNDQFLLDIDDIQVTKVLNNDLSIRGIVPPSFPCALTNNESIGVRFRNETASAANNVLIQLSINGTPTDTIIVPTVAPNATDSVLFTGVDLSVTGQYQIAGRVIFAADEAAGNNVISIPFQHLAPTNLASTVGFTSFEDGENLNLWTINNANNDAFTWTRFVTPGLGSSGDGYMAYPSGTGTTTQAANDWLIGGCYTMQQDTAYQFEFFLNATGAVLHNLEVKLGRSIRIDSLTIPVSSTTDFAETGQGIYTRISSGVTVPKNGTYFLGFRAFSPAGQGRMRLDAIKLRKTPKFDLSIVEIVRPADGGYVCGSPTEKITIRAKNEGSQDLVGAPVTLFRITQTTQTPFNFVIPNLAVGQTENFTYDAGIDLSNPDLYAILAAANVTGDLDKTNDTAFVVVEVVEPVSAPLSDNFESLTGNETPEGWFNSNFISLDAHGKDNSLGVTANLYVNDPTFGTVDRAELITPKIEDLDANSKLVFDYRIVDFASYPANPTTLSPGDSLKVQVATDCGNFQTVFVADASNHNAETEFKRVFVDMAPFASAGAVSIRFLAIHNGLTGDYYIDIDNFAVRQVADFDLSIKTLGLPPYSSTPVKHIRPIRPRLEVSNEGFQTLGPVSLSVSINPGNYSGVSNVGGVTVGSSALSIFPQQFTPSGIGTYSIKYTASTSVNQPDGEPVNNSDSANFDVTDTTYARDYGQSVPFGLGFGSGTRNNLGQVYELTVPDTLTSITFWVDELDGGAPTVKPIIYGANINTGIPNSAILDTNFANFTVPDGDFLDWFTVPTKRATAPKGRALAAGRYLIGLREKSNYMSLGFNFTNAAPFTSFFRLQTGAWIALDTVVGPCQLFIRPNFRPALTTGTTSLEKSLHYSSVFPNPAQDVLNLDIKLNKDQNASILISDISGKLIQTEEVALNRGSNVKSLAIQQLKSGFYFVTIQIGENKVTHKFLKN